MPDDSSRNLPSTTFSTASVAAQSTPRLIEAIRSPEGREADEAAAYVIERARAVRKLGYVPDETAAEEQAAVQEFVVALSAYPLWAIERAFDEWVRTMTRKPTPGDIVIHARRAVKPITEEIAERRKLAAPTPMGQRTDEERENAKHILAEAGFTPRRFAIAAKRPMLSHDDLRAGGPLEHFGPPKPPPSWTNREELERVRSSNPMMRAAREAAAAERNRDDDEGAA